MSAVGDPPIVLGRESDYQLVRKLIREQSYTAALDSLDRIRNDFPEEAEIFSLTGFALRKLGRLDEAFTFYKRALTLDPDHKGANEYLGELYVQIGRVDLAEERLRTLRTLCPSGCEEADDLAAAIQTAKQ